MSEDKSSISQAKSYEEMAEFWDSHDLEEYWDQTHPVEFEIEKKNRRIYFAIESTLSKRLFEIAKKQGVSPETLVNLWLQEKLFELEQNPTYQVAEK